MGEGGGARKLFGHPGRKYNIMLQLASSAVKKWFGGNLQSPSSSCFYVGQQRLPMCKVNLERGKHWSWFPADSNSNSAEVRNRVGMDLARRRRRKISFLDPKDHFFEWKSLDRTCKIQKFRACGAQALYI